MAEIDRAKAGGTRTARRSAIDKVKGRRFCGGEICCDMQAPSQLTLVDQLASS